MFRRSSYASVAAGSSGQGQGQAQNPGPTRAGAFSHLLNNSSSNSNSNSTNIGPQAIRHPRQHSHSHSRSLDQPDGFNEMPRSWGHSRHVSSQFGDTLPEFFVPSYLRNSRHAEKLEDVHKAKIAAQREHRSNHSSNVGSLSRSSSSANLPKMVPSHRGMTHDIIERPPPFADEAVAPWPTKWNEADKYSHLELDEGGRLVKFPGPAKGHDEAASVRADHPMPRECGIYYYEVTIVSKGKDGMIGVGLSGPKVALTRIPGWEPDSYAYHGDDGQCFSNTTSGKPYAGKFGTLDVIGCGVNFRTGSCFFTKNGQHLGTAFRDLKPDKSYYPTVGMKKSGETLRANFGQEPFAFDIDKMVQAEKAEIQAEIGRLREPRRTSGSGMPPFDETAFIHGLVGQYLSHDGYVESARAFSEEVNEEASALANDNNAHISYVPPEDDLDAINRQKIRAAILEGDIDKALKHTNAYYPSVLRDNENIYFKLRCRKFIEMIRRNNELTAQVHYLASSSPSKRSHASHSHSQSHNDEYDFEMELDEQLGVHHSPPTQLDPDLSPNPHSDTTTTYNPNDSKSREDSADDEESAQARLNKLTEETIQYGVILKQEFAADPRREVKRALEDTFALIAYENVVESHLAPLLEEAGRVPVAEELNSAILVSLGKSPSAALERLVQQTEALVEELGSDGGAGAFINVRRDFLQ